MGHGQDASARHFDLLNHELKGINLIEASAGTGKTYTITGLFLRLLLEKQMAVRDILVVTFTDAATEELKDRIRRGIGSLLDALKTGSAKDEFQQAFICRIENRESAIKALKEALNNFDEANIFTIHSFCRRMLNENAFESGILFDVELIKDDSEIKRGITEDYWRKHIIELPPYMIKFLKENSAGKITFPYLLGLADRIDDLSNIRLIPEGGFEIENIEEKYLRALNCVRDIWNAHQDNIKKVFTDTSLFNQTKYRADRMAGMLERFGRHLNSREIPPPDFEKLEKLTMSEIEAGLKKGQRAPSDEFGFFAACEDLIRVHEEFGRIIPAIKVSFIRFVESELRERKHKKNVQSFSDLLVNLRNALNSESGPRLAENISARFRAALIDEFQDTDPVQFEIFETIFSNERNILFLIGDPKQAIYGFRGADIFAYMKASQNPAYSKRTLGTNFRSQPDLISAVNLIFERENAFLFNGIQYNSVNAPDEKVKKDERLMIDGEPYTPLHFWTLNSAEWTGNPQFQKLGEEEVISYSTASEIKRLLRLGKDGRALIGERAVEERDFAVLVKKNVQAMKIQKALTELGIPGVIYNSGNVFRSHEALELERLLSPIADPSGSRFVRAALITDILGLTCEEIDKMTEDESLYEEWLEKFREYGRIWQSSGFIKMFRELLNNEKVMPRLMRYTDGERRNTNMLHLMELLHQAETEIKPGAPLGLLHWMRENMNSEDTDKEEHQLRLESDEKAVKIITVHKSKGLEYPVVFLPFMWTTVKDSNEFLFHDINNGARLTWELGSDDYTGNQALYQNERLAEELRLFYVAITRARNCCYLVLKEGQGGMTGHLFSDPEGLAKRSEGAIVIYDMPAVKDDTPPLNYSQAADELKSRKFTGEIDCRSKISSYTSLIHGHKDIYIPLEADIPADEDGSQEELSGGGAASAEDDFGRFELESGMRVGLCVHEILEEVEFTGEESVDKGQGTGDQERETENDDRRGKDGQADNPGLGWEMRELVERKLKKYRIGSEFAPAVCGMILDTLNVPLLGGEIILKNVPKEKRIHEMEFYFPMGKVSGKGLADLFRELYKDDKNLADFHLYTAGLRSEETEGFMNGLVDLIFEWNGKYYIADWKTNHLGSSTGCYSQENILKAMKKELYVLQYHIYCAAVDRFLKSTMPDYDYNKHFGGVFYLFLRGIDAKMGEEFGVYFHRPEEEVIRKVLSVSCLRQAGVLSV